MYRLVGFATVAAAIYVSCYQPSYRDCEISCTAQSGCPDGLSCDTGAGRCALNGACGAIGDGPLGGFKDAPGSGSSGCWPYAPSNYMPCNGSLPNAAAFSSATTTIIDTGTASCSYGNGDVCLFHFTSMDITGPLHIMGPRPLILVSDGDITVRAPVTYDGSVGSGGANCTAAMPTVAGHIGAGGGGGGYGAPGAPGGTGGSAAGAGSNVSGGAGGPAYGSGSLEPLYPGCPGADGGSGSGASGGARGFGGGAIELSAKGNLVVMGSGLVSADGAGGSGGVGSGSANFGGGGGGGAGGAVLLEASYVTVAGSMCAVGGGGGEGGASTSGVGGIAGSGCTRGAGGSTGVGAGGAGGGSSSPGTGTPAGTVIAAGGGGGGVGRTRIHSPLQTPTTTGSTIVPIAVTQ